MRRLLWLLCLAWVPMTAASQSLHTVQLINDTRSQILSFWIAPAGSRAWVKVDFAGSPFEYGDAYDITLGGEVGCERDFRTVLSDGRVILAANVDVCRLHAYRPQRPFWQGHAGTGVLP